MTETGEKGFTLVEVLVAMAIFAFGMLAVLGMFVASMNGGVQGRKITEASNLAASKIADLKLIPYPDLVSDVGTIYNDTTNVTNDSTSDTYARTWSIYGNVAPPMNLLKVVVTTSWTDRGRTHSVTVQSLITKQ